MKHEIPGVGPLEINTIILDLNGTLSVGGVLVEGVKERINTLNKLGYHLVLFTGNTRNNADAIAEELSIDWKPAISAAEKKALAETMNPQTCAAIGNGLIDIELMKTVLLRILTLQAEGIHREAIFNSDIIVPSINDALDLFIDPRRLIATIRK